MGIGFGDGDSFLPSGRTEKATFWWRCLQALKFLVMSWNKVSISSQKELFEKLILACYFQELFLLAFFKFMSTNLESIPFWDFW